MNSADSPQFFTTEALIRHGIFDHSALSISEFADQPHYFVWPDYFVKDGQLLNLRGYMVSIFSIPLHHIASQFHPLVQTADFAPEVVHPEFSRELLITSCFTIYSVVGLFLLWLAILRLGIQKWVATMVILTLAFGTYIWKYSSLYARHGPTVATIGLAILAAVEYFTGKNKGRWLSVGFLAVCINFGIDSLLFITSAVMWGVMLADWIVEKYRAKNHSGIRHLDIPAIVVMVIAVGIGMSSIVGNMYWYGSLTFSQTHRAIWFEQIMPEQNSTDSLAIWFSTPLWPTMRAVLFNTGLLPNAVFENFESLPIEIAQTLSVSYAQRYLFYGLFTITPVLFLGIVTFFLPSNKKNLLLLSWFSLFFFIGVGLNSKVLGFWAGNQYDVRYFYPYTMLLGVPLAIVIQYMVRIKGMRGMIALLLVMSLMLHALFMGWLGVMQMYKPALTGEQRLAIRQPLTSAVLSQKASQDLVYATAMNRRNVLIPITATVLIAVCYGLGKYFVLKRNSTQHL